MSIADTDSRDEYLGNGITTTFTYTFRILDDDHISVYVNGVLKTLNTDYSVSDVGSAAGIITMVTAPANAAQVIILRNVPVDQESNYIENEAFPAERIERDLDKLAMILQEFREIFARVPKFNPWSLFKNIIFNDPVASYVLRWKSDLTAIEAASITALGVQNADVITAKGDLIQGGNGGVPESLGIVTNGLLGEASGKAAWKTAEQVRTLLSAEHAGTVKMVRSADSGNDPSINPATWVVYKPDGSTLDTTGTTTQGLQEALNYRAQYGYDMVVEGGTVKPMIWNVPYGGALGNNPFATLNATPVVLVTHVGHGLTTGMHVSYTGVPGGGVNGIPAVNFSTFRAITFVDANSYTISLGSNATSTGSAGGASVRFQHYGVDPAIISSATSTITFPPSQKGSIRINGVTLNVGGSVGTGINIESTIGGFHLEWDGGQIVCGVNTDIGVSYKPTLELPLDAGGPAITASTFKMPPVVMLKAGAKCHVFDTISGNIGEGNYFEFLEPNGGAWGIQVLPSASFAFRGNTIRVAGAHAQTTASVGVGINATNATQINGNIWQIECDPSATGIGVDVWGVNDIFDISVQGDEGPAAVGIKMESTADSNIIKNAKNAATIPITDVSPGNNVIIRGTSITVPSVVLTNLAQVGYHEISSMTTPAAPAAGKARFYADTSGGKIRLRALFPSGASQAVATEP